MGACGPPLVDGIEVGNIFTGSDCETEIPQGAHFQRAEAETEQDAMAIGPSPGTVVGAGGSIMVTGREDVGVLLKSREKKFGFSIEFFFYIYTRGGGREIPRGWGVGGGRKEKDSRSTRGTAPATFSCVDSEPPRKRPVD